MCHCAIKMVVLGSITLSVPIVYWPLVWVPFWVPNKWSEIFGVILNVPSKSSVYSDIGNCLINCFNFIVQNFQVRILNEIWTKNWMNWSSTIQYAKKLIYEANKNIISKKMNFLDHLFETWNGPHTRGWCTIFTHPFDMRNCVFRFVFKLLWSKRGEKWVEKFPKFNEVALWTMNHDNLEGVVGDKPWWSILTLLVPRNKAGRGFMSVACSKQWNLILRQLSEFTDVANEKLLHCDP